MEAALIHAVRLGAFRYSANAPKNPNYTKKNDPHSQLKTTGSREEAAMASIHLSVMVPSSKYRLLQAFYDVTFESTLTTLSLPLLL